MPKERTICIDQIKKQKKIAINLSKAKNVVLRHVSLNKIDVIEIEHCQGEEEEYLYTRFFKNGEKIADSPLGLIPSLKVREYHFTVYLEV